jgi:ubiquinone/menaquinone biosynthesis C-methylase UbiE
MALPLTESDEPNRYSIQLYHSVAAQVDLTGKRVLEVSCGHGGGASYVMRTLGPASYTGLDLNPVGLDLCRKKHQLPGLEFVEGNAEQLPFPDQSFDAVINVEASHCYPRFPQFLEEVARVLRPGGHFLYADVRRRPEIARWEEELGDAPMRRMSERVINEQVARGVEKIYPVSLFKKARVRESFSFAMWVILYRRLLNNDISYRIYCFANE